MALHGNLQVNGTTIGLYAINRTDLPHSYANWFYYEWEYVRTENLTHRYTGIVSHRYADGAERLLEKVMASLQKALRVESYNRVK